MISKFDLRQQFSKRVKSISPLDHETASQQICDHLKGLTEIQDAKAIAGFSPLNDEADITSFLKWTISNSHLYFPAFRAESNNYRFQHVSSLRDELREGKYNIPEPSPGISEQADTTDIDVILLPGIAFDRSGTRLGRGGGYYDQLLAHYDGLRVGIAFSCQLSTQPLPREAHDMQLDILVTDTQIYRFHR